MKGGDMWHDGRLLYQRADRKAAVALLVVVAACVCVVAYMGGGNSTTDAGVTDTAAVVQARSVPERHAGVGMYAGQRSEGELFAFDPNTADSTALLRLGLKPWQVRSIYKYRAKGGIYRRPSDFARLYGLTVGQYKRMEPYIRISAEFMPASTLVKEEQERRDTLRYVVKIKASERIVLNGADTSELKRVPGIGGYFARAIVRYGRRLGGYVSVGQLDEIDDFPSDAKQYFVVANPQPRKLNLNRMTLAELRRHPYISFYQAKAIIDYRRLHGPLRSLGDLRLSRDFTAESVRRLEPYIEF